MKKYLIIALAISFAAVSCIDGNFLNQNPKAKISPSDYFKTETDLQLFTNPLYDLLNTEPYNEQSDLVTRQSLSDLQKGWSRQVPASGSGWSWGTLRRINALLANSSNCEDPKVVAKYNALAKFFRAYFYFEKVMRFGDVPWIDHELTTDSPELYAERDSRELVMSHMLEDIDEAIAVLGSGVSTYRVNKYAALALKARFCLYEGTWRKYHALNIAGGKTAEQYLQLAVEAAQQIMDSGIYKLAPSYLNLFAEEDADAGEYILAIKRDISLNLTNNSTAYATMPSQGRPGLTKKAVDMFLMADGSRFTDKEGWETMQFVEETSDRDPRLACVIVTPGYKRIGGTDVLAPDYGCSITGFQLAKWVMDETLYSVNRVDMSYNDTPVFRLGEVYLNYAEAKAELGTLTQEDIDKSINRLRDRVKMPHLDMAQANANPDPYLLSAEYGYRNVSGTNQGVILEIRRERAVELSVEGFRYQDLMRWKEGKCLEQAFVGPYFPGTGKYDLSGDKVADLVIYTGTKPTDKDVDVRLLETSYSTGISLSEGTKGYVNNIDCLTIDNRRFFDEERDYLYPIPTDDRSLNHNLKQNPGWKDGLDF